MRNFDPYPGCAFFLQALPRTQRLRWPSCTAAREARSVPSLCAARPYAGTTGITVYWSTNWLNGKPRSFLLSSVMRRVGSPVGPSHGVPVRGGLSAAHRRRSWSRTARAYNPGSVSEGPRLA